MRIALTGGTGHLGQHVIRALTDAGHSVQLLVRASSSRAPIPAVNGTTVHMTVVDLANVNDIARALQGCHAVVHAAAALTGDQATQHQATVEGTRAVLAAMQQAGIQRVVGIGSMSVYGYTAMPHGSTLDEHAPLETSPASRDVYARCKLAQDALFRHFAQQPGCEAIVLRPGIFYDADTLWQFSLGKALGQRAWVVMGPLTPDSEVPLVHVADVAQAVALALSCDSELNGSVFNLIESPAPTSQALLQALTAQRVHPKLIRLPWTLHLALAHLARWLAHTLLRGRLPLPGLLNPNWLAARFTRVHYDAKKAQRQLGWQPVHNALADLAQRPPH